MRHLTIVRYHGGRLGDGIWRSDLVVPPRPVLSNEKRAGTRKRVEKKKRLMFDHVEAVVKYREYIVRLYRVC